MFSGLDQLLSSRESELPTTAPRRRVFDLRLRSPLRSEPIKYMMSGSRAVLGMRTELYFPLNRARGDWIGWSLAHSDKRIIPFHVALGKMMMKIDSDHKFSDEYCPQRTSEPPLSTAFSLLELNRELMKLPPSKLNMDVVLSNEGIQARWMLLHTVEDFVSYAISVTDGSGDYSPKFASLFHNERVWVGIRGVFMIAVGKCFCLIVENEYTLLWTDELRLLFELVYVRYVCELACTIGHDVYRDSYPPPEVVKKFFRAGDRVLIRQGNEGFRALKFIEPLCISTLLKDDEFSFMFDDRAFGVSIETECSEVSPAFTAELTELLKSIADERHWVSQLFGLFRAFGHPYVDVPAGVRKVRAVSQAPKVLNTEIIDKITAAGIEEFCTNYRRRNGKWPRLTVPAGDREVYSAYRESRAVNQHSSRYDLMDWLRVRSRQTFQPSEVLDSIDLIEDKACSANRDELLLSLKGKQDLPPSLQRKTILKFLAETNYDILEELKQIDKEGLPENDLIIGVTPKERELKIEPRLFSLMTFRLRMYITATERMLSEFLLPYFPDVTMTYSLSDLRRKMYGIGARMSEAADDEVHIVMNLDFEKWNLNFRHEVVARLFTFFDGLCGYDNLISRTHLFFSESTFYIADRFSVVTEDQMVNGRGRAVWSGHYGGMEGLRQKGWTLVTSAVLRSIAIDLGVRLEVMGQGDNQVVIAHIPIDRRYASGEMPDSIKQSTTNLFHRVREQLHDTFQQLGLPIKKEETWTSSRLFAYGKVLIHQGVQLAMSLKRAARMFFENNEFIPTFFNAVSSVGTSAEAMSEYDIGPDVAFLLMCCETYRTVDYYRHYHLLTGKSVTHQCGRLSGAEITARQVLTRPMVQMALRQQENLVKLMCLSNVYLGGYPLPAYYDLCVKGFPDKLFLVTTLLMAAMDKGERSKSWERFGASSILSPQFSEEKDYSRLFEDPYALNLDRPPGATELVRVATREFLHSEWVKNEGVKLLLMIEKNCSEELIARLATMNPCLPRLCSIILENTPTGLCARAISKFEKPDTIQRFARRHNEFGMAQIEMRIADADCAHFLYFLHTFSRPRHTWKPPLSVYHRLSKMRKDSWGLDVEGVTVPPPFWIFGPHETTAECPESWLPDRTHVRATTSDPTEIHNTYGSQISYQGSHTKQKDSTHSHYIIQTKSAPLRAAKTLSSHKGWLYSDESSGLGLLMSDVIASLTDVPIDYFASDVVSVESSTGHRLQDTRAHHHGFPGIISTVFSHFAVSTNSMGRFARGEQNHPIHFQHVICYAQHMALELIRGKRHLAGTKRAAIELNLHLHVITELEVPPLNDNMVTVDYDESNRLKHDIIVSRATFTALKDVKIGVRVQAKHSDVELDPFQLRPDVKNRVFSQIVGQECLRSILRRMDRVSTSSVAKDALPYVWYSRCDPKTVFSVVVDGLIGYALHFLSRNLCVKLQGDPKEMIEDFVVRFWAVVDPNVFTVLLEFVVDCEIRRRMYASDVVVSFPRSVPPSRSALIESVHRTLIQELLRNLQTQSRRSLGPYQYETTGDALGWQAIVCNFNSLWYGATCVDKLIPPDAGIIPIFARCNSEVYRRREREMLPQVGEQLADECFSLLTTRVGPKIAARYRGIITSAYLIGHYLCSLESLSGHAGALPCASYPVRPNSRQTPASKASYMIALRDVSEYSHQHTPLCKFPEKVLPNRHFLRPLRLETGAIYKWFSILTQHLEMQVGAGAALGDGSGGVCALIGKLWPDSQLYFNTLFTIRGRASADFTGYFPQAIEHARIDPARLHGISCVVDGVSDLTSPAWPGSFLKHCTHNLDIITCDAEGSGWGEQDKGILMLTQILRVAERAGPKALIVFKHYLLNVDALNSALRLIVASGGTPELRGSIYTSKRSSEVFIVARPVSCWKVRGVSVSRWMGITCDDAKRAIMKREDISDDDIRTHGLDQEHIVDLWNLFDELDLARYALITLGIPMNFIRRRDVISIMKHILLLPHRLYGVKYLQHIRDPRDVIFPFTRIGDDLLAFVTVTMSLILHGTRGINADYTKLGIVSVCAACVGRRWILVPFCNNKLKDKLYQLSLSSTEAHVYVWALPARYFESRAARELFRKIGAYQPFAGGLLGAKMLLDSRLDDAPNIFVKFPRACSDDTIDAPRPVFCIRWPKSDLPLYSELMSGFDQFVTNILHLL